MIKIAPAILTSLTICLLLGPWMINQLAKMRVGQHIRKEGPKRHQIKAGTPTMGGILIIFSAFVSMLMWSNLKNPKVLILIFSVLSFGIIGFIDDYMMHVKSDNTGLTAKQKLLFQITAATITSFMFYTLPDFTTKVAVPFYKELFLDFKLSYILFTNLVIIGASNAVNLTDGLDGMAAGTTITAKTAYMFLAIAASSASISSWLGVQHIFNSLDMAICCGSFIGAILGFLYFNIHPAKIFMGNIGSLSIGASLGTIAILIKCEILLIVIGGIFVVEAMSVILQVTIFKSTKGFRLFRMAPLHHHFELNGMAESKIVLYSWIISIALALVSITMLKLVQYIR